MTETLGYAVPVIWILGIWLSAYWLEPEDEGHYIIIVVWPLALVCAVVVGLLFWPVFVFKKKS